MKYLELIENPACRNSNGDTYARAADRNKTNKTKYLVAWIPTLNGIDWLDYEIYDDQDRNCELDCHKLSITNRNLIIGSV
jgi:hypothetical protein